jgi:DNA-binding protein H-NS
MATLINIQEQIEALKKQAEALRAKDFDATVADIRKTMTAYGITAKDLLASPKKGARKGKVLVGAKEKTAKVAKVAKTGAKVEAKYRGPNGEAWSGRGIAPKWLSVLIAEGKTKEDFAIVQTTPATTV